MSRDPVIRALAGVVPDLPGGRLRVDIHHDVFDADGTRHDPTFARYLLRAAARAEIDLRVHDCFSDAELWAYLESLDVSVLPYRFGTHSGWLEACFNLGTTVIAPSCGYFAEQHPCLSYRHDEAGLDASSLADAGKTTRGLPCAEPTSWSPTPARTQSPRSPRPASPP